jgi:outer membrane protein TolC
MKSWSIKLRAAGRGLIFLRLTVALPIAVAQAAEPAPVAGLTNQPFAQPLSLPDAVNLALRRNANILRARKDVEAAEGVMIQTRAIAVPKVRLTAHYSAVEESDVEVPPPPATNFTFGTDQSWAGQVRLIQSLYEGGRINSAFRVGRLTREQSVLNYQTAVANTVFEVQTAFFDVLLNAEQIGVQEASIELLERELADTTRRFDAGTVPRFNVLRAEVEVANARPRLIRVRNAFRIAKNNLVNLLGFDVPKETLEDIPLQLAGKLEAEPYQVELPRAIFSALDRRSELGALRKAEALRKEDIVSARSGYKPSLQAYVGYDSHSSVFGPELTDEAHGWITGVQLSWDIFDGFRTRGRIQEAAARYDQAGIELSDAGRRIELEVRTAYSSFTEAREVLESQKKVLEQAEEAVRLASARSEAGAGTQLDVLSAQTALTEARTTQVQALRDFAVARARLERATGVNLPPRAAEP